jgi:hypothetical protein
MSLLFQHDFGQGDPATDFQKRDKPLRERFHFALKSAPLEPQGSHGDLLPAQSRYHAAQETRSSDVLILLC